MPWRPSKPTAASSSREFRKFILRSCETNSALLGLCPGNNTLDGTANLIWEGLFFFCRPCQFHDCAIGVEFALAKLLSTCSKSILCRTFFTCSECHRSQCFGLHIVFPVCTVATQTALSYRGYKYLTSCLAVSGQGTVFIPPSVLFPMQDIRMSLIWKSVIWAKRPQPLIVSP